MRAILRSTLTKNQKLVLASLFDHEDQIRGGSCFPSIETVARDACIRENEVYRARNELREAGLLTWTGSGTRNRVTNYHLAGDLQARLEGMNRVKITLPMRMNNPPNANNNPPNANLSFANGGMIKPSEIKPISSHDQAIAHFDHAPDPNQDLVLRIEDDAPDRSPLARGNTNSAREIRPRLGDSHG